MTRHRFFVPGPLDARATHTLSADQTRQARGVLRLRPGKEVTVFDGSGAEFSARLEALVKDRWRSRSGEPRRPNREPSPRLTVGLALLRNERFDLAVQKQTEIGVAGIAPLEARRRVVSYLDARAWEKRRARLERVIIEAAEQSERTTLPALLDPLPIRGFLDKYEEGTIIALVERRDSPPVHTLERSERIAPAVGPERGWSPDELALFDGRGVVQAGLGRLILRAETTAIAAAGILTQLPADAGKASS